MDAGRYFLERAVGKSHACHAVIKELRGDPRVYEVIGPMRRWKMESEDVRGKGLVKKETRWLTNSPHLAKALSGVW